MFFKTPAFGLDISDYSIEIISLKGSFYNPRLFAMGRSILEPGGVEDGKIINKEILKRVLSDLIKSPKFGKLKTNKFIFSLPESKCFIHIFELPKALKKKKELEFIKSEVNQNVPLSIEDLYFDFKINRKQVFFIGAQKSVVKDYLEVFRALRLCPLAIESESESLGRSLIQDQVETVLIADIGARTTNFSIFDSGELRFSSTLEVAGNKFTKSLSNGLGISFNEAERLKKESGLNPRVRKGKSFLILQRDIQAIVLEIRNIEKYFQRKESKKLKKVILAGGSAMLPLLPQYLNENLEKPVIIGDPWAKVDINILKKKQYFEKALEINPILYSTCIGSALRGLFKNPKRAGMNLMKG